MRSSYYKARFIEPMSLKERIMNHAYNLFVELFLSYLNDHLIYNERIRQLKLDIPSNNDILRLKLRN